MIHIVGPWNNRSYGLVTRNICKELRKTQEVCLWPIADHLTEPLDLDDYNKLKLGQENYRGGPSIRIWHHNNLAEHVGAPRIGFPIFELNKFTPREISHMKGQDALFVCSKWAADLVGQFAPTHVIPLGYDPNIFFPAPKNNPRTVFVNAGKWEVRKGHHILVDAFNAAFTEKDDVELLMMCHNPFLTQFEQKDWEKIYLTSKLGKKIKIIPWLTNQEEVANIFRKADCGVFPSHAEGWNLEAVECMACGCDCILTDYSGHTEFNFCRTIQIDETEPAFDGKWFFGQGDWAKFDQNQFDQLVEHMRAVHKGPKRSYDVSHLTWKDTCKHILKAL